MRRRLGMDPITEVNRPVDSAGTTKLILAAKEGAIGDVTRLLAVPGIDVNKADEEGLTPLLVTEDDEIRALLRAAGARE